MAIRMVVTGSVDAEGTDVEIPSESPVVSLTRTVAACSLPSSLQGCPVVCLSLVWDSLQRCLDRYGSSYWCQAFHRLGNQFVIVV